MQVRTFKNTVLTHYKSQNRQYPWRETQDPYAIYISEMMLQQTQTDRVIPKYIAWMKRFQTMQNVVHAPLAEILQYWQGLGYNRRALYIKESCSAIVKNGGVFPTDSTELDALPGIGQYTARAIATFSTNTPHVFIETNIRRVFIHHFFSDKTAISDSDILQLVAETMDRENPREWYWALMDYGSYLGKNLKRENPNKRSKNYSVQSRFEGSDRQIRGAILRELTSAAKRAEGRNRQGSMSQKNLEKVICTTYPHAAEKWESILDQLIREGFIRKEKSTLHLA